MRQQLGSLFHRESQVLAVQFEQIPGERGGGPARTAVADGCRSAAASVVARHRGTRPAPMESAWRSAGRRSPSTTVGRHRRGRWRVRSRRRVLRSRTDRAPRSRHHRRPGQRAASDAIRPRQNRTGSASIGSHENHAGRSTRSSAHAEMRVVFPKPAGAETTPSRHNGSSSRATSDARGTMTRAERGIVSLVDATGLSGTLASSRRRDPTDVIEPTSSRAR